MQVVQTIRVKLIREMSSSVSPKGQITIPVQIRQLLGVKPKDKISFKVDGNDVRITPSSSSISKFYQLVPALKTPHDLKEIIKVAQEEHSNKTAKEGL